MSTVWWLDALKRAEKVIGEAAFEQTKKKPGLKFNPRLELIGFRTNWALCFQRNKRFIKSKTKLWKCCLIISSIGWIAANLRHFWKFNWPYNFFKSINHYIISLLLPKRVQLSSKFSTKDLHIPDSIFQVKLEYEYRCDAAST